jgi:hypothetical protein
MKYFTISFIALVSLSTASLAGDNRNYELRDSDTYVGKYASQSTVSRVKAYALAGPAASDGLSNAEIIKRNQEINESSSH